MSDEIYTIHVDGIPLDTLSKVRVSPLFQYASRPGINAGRRIAIECDDPSDRVFNDCVFMLICKKEGESHQLFPPVGLGEDPELLSSDDAQLELYCVSVVLSE